MLSDLLRHPTKTDIYKQRIFYHHPGLMIWTSDTKLQPSMCDYMHCCDDPAARRQKQSSMKRFLHSTLCCSAKHKDRYNPNDKYNQEIQPHESYVHQSTDIAGAENCHCSAES